MIFVPFIVVPVTVVPLIIFPFIIFPFIVLPFIVVPVTVVPLTTLADKVPMNVPFPFDQSKVIPVIEVFPPSAVRNTF